ncbi:alpha/beta hydrolase [Endozoicomonas sp. SM1973]|uniref:Alpha/beta hydrolase n=1 Tax=Spartinivicinus marinus TaxID=2994442 RepID=A0A853I0N8_9GAMM|nr:alpha/beta hydrolase [Spartinivicinus marinus]MCX4029377.1 alpha/beta hydrolase [Spartinivicinus marinus]NYZ64952.1 alpha/beta hydrolase [Spartinivicinus marinus]
MKYITEGSGEYLILVHGALTDATMWLPHINHLKSDYEVISVTLRYFNGEDKGSFGLNTHASDLAELLAKLFTEKPINIVGWSYGADVVLNMLLRYKVENVSGIFLYEPGFPGCLPEQEIEMWLSDANAMFGRVCKYFSEGKLELAVEVLIDASGNKQGYFKNQHLAIRELQLSKAYTLAYQLNQQEQPDITCTNVSNIRNPLVIGYGSQTRDIFRLVATNTAKLSEAFKVKEIVGEGHMLPQENPEKFSVLIKNVISSLVGHGSLG